jgi:hypothetical protein
LSEEVEVFLAVDHSSAETKSLTVRRRNPKTAPSSFSDAASAAALGDARFWPVPKSKTSDPIAAKARALAVSISADLI